MQTFVSRHQHQIQGTLSGFDRLRFVGSLLKLSYVSGLGAFLGVCWFSVNGKKDRARQARQ
jgi:hypothetical protein